MGACKRSKVELRDIVEIHNSTKKAQDFDLSHRAQKNVSLLAKQVWNAFKIHKLKKNTAT